MQGLSTTSLYTDAARGNTFKFGGLEALFIVSKAGELK